MTSAADERPTEPVGSRQCPRPINVGGLRRAWQLEQLALLGITPQGRLNLTFKSGWKRVAEHHSRSENDRYGQVAMYLTLIGVPPPHIYSMGVEEVIAWGTG